MKLAGLEKEAIEEAVEQFGTPLYIYNLDCLETKLKRIKEVFPEGKFMVLYSLKANSNPLLLYLIKDYLGAEVVSRYELLTALHAGFPPSSISFAGVGKTKEELKVALEKNIFSINVESREELLLLEYIAEMSGRRARVGIRVNPELEFGGTLYRTGVKESKFGVSPEEAVELFKYAKRSRFLSPFLLHAHIGSQILDIKPFEEEIRFLKELADTISGISHLDIGGGIGIAYSEEEKPFSIEKLRDLLEPLTKDYKLVLEPGRYVVGDCGLFVTRVLYRKEKGVVIVDAGFSDFLRPAMYGVKHRVVNLREDIEEEVQLGGPICEPRDTFGKYRISSPKKDDILVFLDAGAYGYVMSSNYNMRPKPPEVIYRGGRFFLSRRRESFEDLLRNTTSFLIAKKQIETLTARVPVTDIRAFPHFKTERVSQLLFGRGFKILEKREGWAYGETEDEGYRGWIQLSHLGANFKPTHMVVVPFAQVLDEHNGIITKLPFNSLVEIVEEGEDFYIIAFPRGKIKKDAVEPLGRHPAFTRDGIVNLARQFIGTPYLWGGTSPFGFDCSGFVQALYRRFGISIPRDTREQIKVGSEVVALEELLKGDLIFFPGHVVMYTGNGRVIHASLSNGFVKEEKLTQLPHFPRVIGMRRIVPD